MDPLGTTLAWGISEQLDEKGRDSWRDYEVSGEAARAAKSNYANIHTQPIRSLLDNVEDDKVRLWAPYSIPDLSSWYLGRVCLIGDAAHALPPNGQGSAMAFEDAALLSRLLDSIDDERRHIFAHFERIRRPRIERVRRLSKVAGGLKSNTMNPWVWWAKKWLIWAYFAWNRFVVRDTRITAYNVMDEVNEIV